MEQEHIERAVKAYNHITKAHKRAPVEKFVNKRLAEGEEVVLSAGQKRWSSALVFKGTLEEPEVEFRINPALPESFKNMLEKQKKQFSELLSK